MFNLTLLATFITSLVTFNVVAFTSYATPAWINKHVYTVDNYTYLVGESEWHETSELAFKSAYADALSKLNMIRNIEVETSFAENTKDGEEFSSNEFNLITSSNDYGNIVIKDSVNEREPVSTLNRAYVLLQVETNPGFDFAAPFRAVSRFVSEQYVNSKHYILETYDSIVMRFAETPGP